MGHVRGGCYYDRLTDIHIKTDVTFQGEGQYAGIVFGYTTSSSDYWVYLVCSGTAGSGEINHVVNGNWGTALAPPSTASVPVGTPVSLEVSIQGDHITGASPASADYTATGLAAGKVGFVASQSDTVLSNLSIRRLDWSTPASPTWQVYRA